MEDKKVFIIRCGEVALKGMNKPYFERLLVERIRRSLKGHKGIEIRREEGLIVLRAPEDLASELIIKSISKVFGVDSISPAIEVESTMEAIGEGAVTYMKSLAERENEATFKVEAKRSEKNFPLKSPEIAREIGGRILASYNNLKVDVHNPQIRIYIHVRRDRTFIFEQKISGFGGLPLGTNGKGLILLSGGIDSPVAAFLMAKRGMFIEAVHFHSYPYTSERAWEKVESLAKILAEYCGLIKVHSVNLLPIQEAIAENCPEDEMTILIRRFMMKIAEKIAADTSSLMLITGENLGQVASQTAEALVVTDHAVNLPVMRPLIGMDKSDIIKIARDIGTYETSILPYEDCCTVFLPKHPKTKPKLAAILESESLLDEKTLIESALANKELFTIKAI